MKRFVFYVSILFVLCLATVSAARLIGSKQPVAFAILFTNADGSPCEHPCLLGIRPGETKFTDAIKLLQAHPFTRGMQLIDDLARNGKVFKATDGSPLIVGIGEDDNGLVALIDLEAVAPQPTFGVVSSSQVQPSFNVSLGQVVSVLGVPDYFQLVDDDLGRKISYSYYDRIQVVTERTVIQHINLADPLISVFMRATPADKRADMRSWIGFSDLSRYFDLATHS